jgi:CheY-like chemotaxis protein
MPRILVVEDEKLLAAIITDVEDAIELLLSAAIDLVLLDCVLPGGTMWQVALEADRQDIPLVLMTGDPEHRKDLVGGARPFLLKPFSIAALTDIVETSCGSAVKD